MLNKAKHTQFKVFTRMLPNAASRNIHGSIYTVVVMINWSLRNEQGKRCGLGS